MHYICRKEGPAALVRWALTPPYKVQRAQGPGLPPLCEVPPPCPAVVQASLCCVGAPLCCFRGGLRTPARGTQRVRLVRGEGRGVSD